MRDGDKDSSYAITNERWWLEYRGRLDHELLSDDEDNSVLRNIAAEDWEGTWFQRAVEIARDMGYEQGYHRGLNDLGQLEGWQERRAEE